MPVTLETPRLILRVPSVDDVEPFAEMFGDPDVTRYTTPDGRPLPRFAAWQALSSTIGHWTLRGFGQFAVIERATGRCIGRIGPWRPEGWPELEIGWTLRSDAWGRGYATEAAARCLAYVFDDLRQSHVVSLILPDNRASIRVAERIGERFERRITLPHLPADRLVLQYGLSRGAWIERARRENDAGG